MGKYEAMKSAVPERVIFDFEPECNPEGKCIVMEYKLQEAAQIITHMNDAVQKSSESANSRLEAIAHCEYANLRKDQAIQYLEASRDKIEITSAIKQVVTGAVCAGVLLTR